MIKETTLAIKKEQTLLARKRRKQLERKKFENWIESKRKPETPDQFWDRVASKATQ